MQQPPRDERGTLPHDHPEISKDDKLIRYINPSAHAHFENGAWRISSAAFSPSSPPNDPRSSVSVDIKGLMDAGGLFPPYRVPNQNFGAASVGVDQVRQEKLMVGWDPQPGNPYHAGIWGKLNKSKKASLARMAAFIKVPLL